MTSELVWTNTTVRLGDLKPWADNPRYSTKAQAKRLLASWKELGQFQTIAIGPACEVYDGHQRLSALLTVYGPDYQIDARQSSRALTDEERQKLVITAHVGAVGSWNWDSLAGWDAPKLQEWGLDSDALKAWNTDAAALAMMLESEKPAPAEDPGADIDRAKELREKWGVKTGQLWKLGDHRLLCGDSTKREDVERVMGDDRAKLMLIDPPYGDLVIFDKDKRVGKSNAVQTKVYGDHYQGEGVFDLAPVLECAKGYYENSVIWGGNYFPHLLGPRTSWLVWDKRAGEHSWYSDVELAWSDLPIPAKLFSYTWQGMIRKGEREERYHPTQKPVALMEWVLRDLAQDAHTVLDLFGGSGVVMLACQNLSRKCRAIEISAAYVAVCLERMATAFTGIEIELM